MPSCDATVLTPSRKGSNGVQSPRFDFCEGPSSFPAVGFFFEMRGTSGDSCQVQFASHFAGFFSGAVAKAFPYGSLCGSNDCFWLNRNLLRYNMADIETATQKYDPCRT